MAWTTIAFMKIYQDLHKSNRAIASGISLHYLLF